MRIECQGDELPRGRVCLGSIALPDASLASLSAALLMLKGLLPMEVSELDVNMECYGGCNQRVRLVEEPLTDRSKVYNIELC